MTGPRGSWRTTTHAWASDVDEEHLADVRARADALAPDGALHLVLEVLAYADEEAAATGRRGQVEVVLDGSRVVVADDGRGTDTRVDEHGAVVRKPVMATQDVRFFDVDDAPLLPDGHPRRGMSVVSALSPALVHENWRTDGAWSQTYRHGVPDAALVPLTPRGGTGTTVTFRGVPGAPVDADALRALVGGFDHLDVTVLSASR
ncbi:ATP-binding protein [Cellulomonas sp. SLBN-39]|uniref:ATP-binding protein n=1 Tax=Cellulomonas sp. SLBN-39 TaxID=2768446 RepID=UPI00114F7229|nr:ATP-binding protein [Cellulomonas sp. SLBN-39]TQL02964.1 DNA gyrase subunit B [Cellulomonas sp. SLBN-39]